MPLHIIIALDNSDVEVSFIHRFIYHNRTREAKVTEYPVERAIKTTFSFDGHSECFLLLLSPTAGYLHMLLLLNNSLSTSCLY